MGQSLVSFNAGVEDGFYANASDSGRANDHVFAGVDFGNRDVDKFFGGCLGHELVAVPFLEFLNGSEADLFFVPTIEGDMDDVFAGRSWHATTWHFK